MPLELTYTADTPIPVEIEGLTPDALAGAGLDEVRRFEIFHGNRRTPVGELFHVAGDTNDLRWHLHGDFSGVHWLGAHLRQGEVHVHGPVGRHAGSQMQGGTLVVEGDAGDWLGGEMGGGQIRVAGSAGNSVGGAYPGSLRGMTGGTILVDGRAGAEVGLSMRRGWITIGGDCGDLPGYAMLAGTIFVLGDSGARPGAGMRRGTIGLFGQRSRDLLPTFRFACRAQPTVLRLMERRLAELAFPVAAGTISGEIQLYQGDFLAGGRGEILLPAD